MTDVLDDLEVEVAGGREAVSDMRATRRRRRLGDVSWGDLAYRVYTTTLVTLVLAVLVSSYIGDRRVGASTVAQFRADAPSWAGLVVAIVILMMVRSGSRGGPIAMEGADVHHLMLAPVDRTSTLRRPTVGVIGYGVAGGAVAGGLVGSLVAQRLPGTTIDWIGVGALLGAVTVGLGVGAALLTSSRRVPRLAALATAWVLFLWAVADRTGHAPAAPTTFVGKIITWPLTFDARSFGGILLAIVMPLIGAFIIGGLSIEMARRRTALVGQLRFAVTQQDLRSVLLLRRQLASERPRNRPWFRRIPRLIGRRLPTVARDLQSVARWPIFRIVRVLVLGIVIGLALRGLWGGTTPLIVVAGLAAYVAGLDCTEPLAQEIDHPTLTASMPWPEGVVMLRHLVEPVIVMAGIGVVALATAYVVDPDVQVLKIGAITLVTGALGAVAGAAVSVVSGAFIDTGTDAMLPPEVAGPRLIIRTGWPPLVAIIGLTPVLGAQRAVRTGGDPVGIALTIAIPVVILVVIVFAWVRFRADIHKSIAEATGGGSKS